MFCCAHTSEQHELSVFGHASRSLNQTCAWCRSQEEFAENKGHGDLTLEKVNVYLDGLVKDLETNLEVAVRMQDLKKVSQDFLVHRQTSPSTVNLMSSYLMVQIAEAEMELNGLHRAHELVELRASLSEVCGVLLHSVDWSSPIRALSGGNHDIFKCPVLQDNSEKVHALEESVQSLKTECAGLCKVRSRSPQSLDVATANNC